MADEKWKEKEPVHTPTTQPDPQLGEAAIGESGVFCQRCWLLYRMGIAERSPSNIRIGMSVHVGSAKHANPKRNCSLCTLLHQIRPAYSPTGEYHLYALCPRWLRTIQAARVAALVVAPNPPWKMIPDFKLMSKSAHAGVILFAPAGQGDKAASE